MTRYAGVAIDVDGTIRRGERLIPGAADGVRAIDAAGCSRVLVSNNPTGTPADYGERLTELGVPVEADAVITAGTVTATVLADRHPDAAALVVGHERLSEMIESAGVRVTSDPAAADLVVGSIDFAFDYDTLARAQRPLNRGVPFYGTDPDPTIPTDDGGAPGSGAILAAMEAVAGRPPDEIFGKPSPLVGDRITSRLGVPADSILVVGDRLETDVALGDACGMDTALVLTGSTTNEALEASTIESTYVLDSLGDVGRVLSRE